MGLVVLEIGLLLLDSYFCSWRTSLSLQPTNTKHKLNQFSRFPDLKHASSVQVWHLDLSPAVWLQVRAYFAEAVEARFVRGSPSTIAVSRLGSRLLLDLSCASVRVLLWTVRPYRLLVAPEAWLSLGKRPQGFRGQIELSTKEHLSPSRGDALQDAPGPWDQNLM